MSLDPTQRFSSRVENYRRYRPSYPRELISLLTRECGLTKQSRIADIGSGTGLLAEVFLAHGCDVSGVEPNLEMRQAGEKLLAQWSGFRSVDGRAEATTLPDGCVDLVTAGQAFHWFEPEQARAEFERILRPSGWVVLIWNERRPAPGFMDGYSDLVFRYGPEPRHVDIQKMDRFWNGVERCSSRLPNGQSLDLQSLQGRFMSASYAPQPNTAAYENLVKELDELFNEYQKDGKVELLYDTEIYFGQLRS
jgi:ubiquinone/menaquinone biosynthesis C-methylase UbiE